MKKIIGLAAFAALVTTSALAAPKFNPPASTATSYNWNGFYVGGNAGEAWGNSNLTTNAPTGAIFGPIVPVAPVNAVGIQKISPSGFTGGLDAGYNLQFGATVVGIEGDIDSMHLNGTKTVTNLYPALAGGGASFTLSSAASTDWVATIRGRVGYSANNWLFFATGGAAFTSLKGTFSFSDNCGLFVVCNNLNPLIGNNFENPISFSSQKTGYAVGGGVERGLSAHWTVRAEYLHVEFGSISGIGTVNNTLNVFSQSIFHAADLKADIVRLGVNYRF